MAKEYTKGFYTSPAWLRCRASYISKRRSIDGGLCERCGEELGVIVHHIKYINERNIDNSEVTLSHKNLELLCRDCHAKEHLKKELKPLRYRFDSKGNILPP